ncbi:phosphate ABC transporter, permease protein PstA, partial [bacterium]
MRKAVEIGGIAFCLISVLFALLSLFLILFFIFINGIKVISPSFLFDFPRKAMTEGGIFPAIVGTFLLSLGAVFFSLPLGVMTAVYLTEYAT